MQYLLMICQNEANRAQMTPAEENALYQEYGQLIQDLTAKGKFLGGNRLTNDVERRFLRRGLAELESAPNGAHQP